ncbi:unnamed protein product [Kluyveromyces dobzhanskii CBS 2104]|uniref:WGS project CCBQ000000000 data, contig 00098 n=1 Tax=Kluyveromyces dobzhanskii CBS 2104 TaxID=1427455 RepID=A0A0A8L5C6_9SACH|nr:unnamed protein product [Kluyveromyces dobzhanskii CBS 2104]
MVLKSRTNNADSQNTDSGTILGCSPLSNLKYPGFEVTYYHYPLAPIGNSGCYAYDNTYQSESYQFGGYETYGGGVIDKSYGVTNLNFKSTYQDSCSTPHKALLPSNYNYNTPITTTNFSMLITGYFYAPKTGSYDFILNYIDDLSFLNVGAGKAFDCCQLAGSVSNPAPFDLSVVWPQSANTVTTYLLGGYYYPIRIFFVNRQGLAGLTVSFKDADGVLHDTFDKFIYSFKDGEECPVPVHTTTKPWDGSGTSTYTTVSEYPDGGGTVTENVIVIEAPNVQTATTEVTGWTGSFTSTYATMTVTETGSNGFPNIKTIYSVETPEVKVNTTEVTRWTGSFTSTYATMTVTETGSDGIPTIKTIYSVETPEVQTATTEVTGWTGSTTNTYGTTTVTETGSNGFPTIKTIYSVETPEVQTATTEVTGWTGTTTNTYGTTTVTETGPNGIPTLKIIYFVKTPESGPEISYTGWTGSFTSTYTTNIVTEVGSDGVPTTKTIYYVQTPEAGPETSYTGWSGNSTTTDSEKPGETSKSSSFSLSTVTKTMNGVITIYTTTCPLDTTTAKTSSTGTVIKDSTADEASTPQTSTASRTENFWGVSTSKTSGVGASTTKVSLVSSESRKNEHSSTEASGVSPETTSLPGNTVATSSGSAQSANSEEQNSSTSTKQTAKQPEAATTFSTSSEGGVKSVYEGGAARLFITPVIALFLALL